MKNLAKILLLMMMLAFSLGLSACIGLPNADTKPEPLPTPIYNPLTGEEVAEDIQARILLVSVDNQADSRPQSGVSQADIAYELPAEGGIPRLLLLFYSQQCDKIGPVRSARPYFIDVAQGWDGLFVHCGWSPQAKLQLQTNAVDYVNEIAYPSYFWRDNQRYAPHNLYTSTDLLYQSLDDFGYDTEQAVTAFLPFYQEEAIQVQAEEQSPGLLDRLLNKDETEETTTEETSGEQLRLASEISINYPSATTYYEYDSATNLYRRSVDGQAFIDKETGEQIQAANIIIQRVSATVIDSDGRLQIDMLAGGTATLFSGGKMVVGYWLRDSKSSNTRYYADNGEEFVLNPGQTWVQVCDESVKIYY